MHYKLQLENDFDKVEYRSIQGCRIFKLKFMKEPQINSLWASQNVLNVEKMQQKVRKIESVPKNEKV